MVAVYLMHLTLAYDNQQIAGLGLGRRESEWQIVGSIQGCVRIPAAANKWAWVIDNAVHCHKPYCDWDLPQHLDMLAYPDVADHMQVADLGHKVSRALGMVAGYHSTDEVAACGLVTAGVEYVAAAVLEAGIVKAWA